MLVILKLIAWVWKRLEGKMCSFEREEYIQDEKNILKKGNFVHSKNSLYMKRFLSLCNNTLTLKAIPQRFQLSTKYKVKPKIQCFESAQYTFWLGKVTNISQQLKKKMKEILGLAPWLNWLIFHT